MGKTEEKGEGERIEQIEAAKSEKERDFEKKKKCTSELREREREREIPGKLVS